MSLGDFIKNAAIILSDAVPASWSAALDAALIQAGVYATEAIGRAAVADGVAFKVQGTGNIAAYEYRRTNSSTSVLIATYPSSAGVRNAVSAGAADMRVSSDLLTALTWAVGILEANGSITGGFGSTTSSFLPVTPNATIIKMVASKNYDTVRPNILGYDVNQQPVSVLLSNGTINATSFNPAYITIPAGIYYVRLCGGTVSTAKQLSVEDLATEHLFANHLDPASGNQLGVGKPQFLSNNTVGVLSGAGTDYVPVQIGDKIRYRLNAAASLAGVGLFNSSKTFIRQIAGTIDRSSIYTYTLDAVADAGAAYIVATDFQPDGTGFFTIERLKTSLTKVNDRVLASLYDNLLGRDKAAYTAYTGNSTVVDNLLTFTTLPAYVHCSAITPKDLGHTAGIMALKLQLVTLPEGTTQATINWYDPGGNSYPHSNSQVFNLNDTYVVWAEDVAGLSHIMSNVAGSAFTVVDSISFRVETAFYATLSALEKAAILSDPALFNRDYILANYSKNAAAADKLSTVFRGGILVTFGDSIMQAYGIPSTVAASLQMSLTNLAVGGTTPQNNLTDTNFALIPPNATIVTITGGANGGAVDAGTISSRDRSTMQGCINYAIDWIYTNRPYCRVVLVTPSQRGASLPWAQVIRDLAVYRSVPLADIDRNAEINPNTFAITQLPDLCHPSAEGVKRQAGVIAGTIRGLSF